MRNLPKFGDFVSCKRKEDATIQCVVAMDDHIPKANDLRPVWDQFVNGTFKIANSGKSFAKDLELALDRRLEDPIPLIFVKLFPGGRLLDAIPPREPYRTGRRQSQAA